MNKVRIWTDGNVHEVFAVSAEQARQWEIDTGGEEDFTSPVEDWKPIPDDQILAIVVEADDFHEDEDSSAQIPDGGWTEEADRGIAISATAEAWVDLHMATDGTIPWLHSTSEF